MTADDIIRLARKHRDDGTGDSARACLADAIEAREIGCGIAARTWALKSLAHSVGVFHPDYRKAAR